MNLTEPDPEFVKAIVAVQYITGAFMIAFNGSVVWLVINDEDKRNKNYRKYLCNVQMSSFAFDTLFDFYHPIFLMHRGLLFSDSTIAKSMSAGIFFIVLVSLMTEVVIAYFACVYYRRSIILKPERRLNYRGRRRTLVFVLLHVYCLVVVYGIMHILHGAVLSAEKSMPSDLAWVRTKTSFVYVGQAGNLRLTCYFAFAATNTLGFATVAMLVQIVLELRRVETTTSLATQRYQRLAVRSLILQGVVPNLVYTIPSYMSYCLQFAPLIASLGENFDRFANIFSLIIWFFITKHTFVGSLTILYCSSSYRKKIISLITR